MLVAVSALSSEARWKNPIPPSAARALSTPADVILYSLEPAAEFDASESQLHNFKILGQAGLDQKQTATAIAEFKKAISNWDGIVAACFDPRHAIRLAANGHIYDFVLCYECHQLYVYEDDKLLKGMGATGSPDILNGLLTSLSLPLAKTASPEEIAAERDRTEKTHDRWLAATPKSLRQFWKKTRDDFNPDLKPFRKALAGEFPDTRQRILALFHWFGSGDGPWSGFPIYEDIPERLLLEFKTAELIAAAEEPQLSDTQLEGAARCLAAWDFSKTRPHDLRIVPPALKKRLLEHSLKTTDTDKQERAKSAFEQP
jgi:hypothetical protein